MRIKSQPHAMESGCCGSKPEPPLSYPVIISTDDEKIEQVDVKHLCIVYNPYSGKGKASREWAIAKPIFEQHSIKLTIVPTKYPLHAQEIAAEHPLTGLDGFVVIGGDGTFHEFIQGLLSRKDGRMIPVGLLPGGTGNNVLRSFGLLDIQNAVKSILSGTVRKIDLGKVTTKTESSFFINLFGWGLGVDGNVTAESCRCCGPARYNVGALVQICKGKRRQSSIQMDGKNYEGDYVLILVQNNQHCGENWRFAPYALINDGKFDCLMCRHLPRCRTLKLFDEVKRNGSHVYFDEVEYRQFQKMTITDPTPQIIMIDGENTNLRTPCTIECLRQILPIFYSK